MVVLGLLVSACSGGDPQPRALPTLATASRTPAPTLAALPEAAKAKTPQGADAFVRYFFSQLNVAFSTSDASIIKALQNGECATCDNYQGALEAARSAGHFLKGNSFEVRDVAAAPLQPLGTTAEVFGAVPPRSQVDARGVVLKELPAGSDFHLVAVLKHGPHGWLVSGLVQGS